MFCLVRSPQNPQLLEIEYVRNFRRRYLCADRDALLATLLDGVRASGNTEVHVKMYPTQGGKSTSISYFIITRSERK